MIGHSWCVENSCMSIASLCQKITVNYRLGDILLYDTPLSRAPDNDTVDAFRLLQSTITNPKLSSIVYIDFSRKNNRYSNLMKNVKRHSHRCLLIADKANPHDDELIDSLKTHYTIKFMKQNCKEIQLLTFVIFVLQCIQKYNGQLPNMTLMKQNAIQSTANDIFTKLQSVIICNIYDYVESHCSSTRPIRDCVKYTCKLGL